MRCRARGFGFDRAGDQFMPQDVLDIGFRFPAGATGNQQRRDVGAFMLGFGTDIHAGAGMQVTIRNGGGPSDDVTRLNQLLSIATVQSAQVGLVAKGDRGGVARGWLLQSGSFVPDLNGERLSPAALLAGATAGNETTDTLVPAGMARRIGIDRDADGALDLGLLLPAWGPCH